MWKTWARRLIDRVPFLGRGRLSPQALTLMCAIAQGGTLKSHRYLDGTKHYRLYSSPGEDARDVSYELVQRLLDGRWLTTNQKFPAATFLLTTKGQEMVAHFVEQQRIRGVNAVVKFDT